MTKLIVALRNFAIVPRNNKPLYLLGNSSTLPLIGGTFIHIAFTYYFSLAAESTGCV